MAVSAAGAHFLLKTPKQHLLSRATFGAVTSIIPTSLAAHKPQWIVLQPCPHSHSFPCPWEILEAHCSWLRSWGSRVGDSGAGRLQGAEPLLPFFPLFFLPFPAPSPQPWHALRGAGCWPGGPALPSPHPWEAQEPVLPLSGVALARGLPPGERRVPAWEGQHSLPGWMAAPAPLPGASPSQGVPSWFYFPAGVWNCRAFLCRMVKEQHSPACPTSPPLSFPLLPFPDQSCLPSLYCKHYSALR